MRLIRKEDIERIAVEIENGNEVYVQWSDCRRPEEIKRSKVSHLTMMDDLKTVDNEIIANNIDYIQHIQVKQKTDTRETLLEEFRLEFLEHYDILDTNIPFGERVHVYAALLRTIANLKKED